MWILTNISQDTDGSVYAGQPMTYDEKEEAIQKAREQLADDFGISVEETCYKAQEGGNPYVLSMSQDGRLEAYTVAWV